MAYDWRRIFAAWFTIGGGEFKFEIGWFWIGVIALLIWWGL